MINPHGHMEDFLDRLHRPADIQERSVGMRGRHRQTLLLGENDDRFIILFRWAELFSELLRAQIMPVLGTGRVVELFEKRGESLLIAQRQRDREI